MFVKSEVGGKSGAGTNEVGESKGGVDGICGKLDR